ncbi:hypothetical protein CANARDRAFT_26916 [[Candida] arabinofermentans NRRL YB-2248]|uniref:Manganese/iron superoxide dismutase C-terminal domain-containing protein n=1 Tax=[Candida] arabinofermentans NRRL YB-2248 TaxID=983967 RepID=A0A1E4T6W9_9ASCO|nr:hypothetical protein CANARDRAFT_26916 [[Candida] arabinofermentans NRRL YB-2248]
MPLINNEIQNQPKGQLLLKLEESFGSLQEFQTLFLSSAKSIKGNGYTWLLQKSVKPASDLKEQPNWSSLVILNTYNHGTPHHFRSGQITQARKYTDKRSAMESKENNNNNDLSDDLLSFQKIEIPSIDEAQDGIEPLEFVYQPLVAIGVNPSFYLRDYGVFGKETYLNNCWNCVDWDIVERRLYKSNDGKTERRFI